MNLEKLTPEAYRITQQSGTEAPFSGKYTNHVENGNYACICCGQVLFSSTTKFESATGWPSFYDCADDNSVNLIEDNTHQMVRVEVRCKKCDAHLGHIFPDNRAPTNQRYCINSVALNFQKI